MKWFRFYSEAMHDPKVLSLRPEMRWHWVAFLCLASTEEVRGRVHNGPELGRKWCIRGDKVGTTVARLCSAGLLDQDGEWLIPHGWNKRQFASDNVTDRVHRHRERNVSETALDTEADTDTETETEKKQQQVRPNIFSLYEQQFGSRITPRLQVILEEVEQEYPSEWIDEAFKEAAVHGARSWNYVEKILRKWQASVATLVVEPRVHFGMDEENTALYEEALADLEKRTQERHGHGIR